MASVREYYSDLGATFPRLSAGITQLLVGGLLLLRVLLEGLQAKLTSTKSSLKYGGDQSEGYYLNWQVVIVLALFVLYLIGVYVLELLIATPIYVYGTLVAFEYAGQLKCLAITVLAPVLAVAGYLVLGVSFTFGATRLSLRSIGSPRNQ